MPFLTYVLIHVSFVLYVVVSILSVLPPDEEVSGDVVGVNRLSDDEGGSNAVPFIVFKDINRPTLQ